MKRLASLACLLSLWASSALAQLANTTWSQSDLSVATLSARFLKDVSGNANGGGRSTTSHSTGKYCYEATVNAATVTGGNQGLGFANAAATLPNLYTSATAVIWFGPSGGVWSNNANTGTIATWGTAGDVLDMCIDIGNKLFWGRKNNGNWNNNVSANPATGTLGATISGLSGALFAAHESGNNLGETKVVNFGATAFVYTMPSGFSAWDSTAADTAVYVATTGSDSNYGTSTSPLLTFLRADQIAVPGSTIHVAPGNYLGSVTTRTAGTSAARIRWLCDVKWSCRIAPSASEVGSTGWDTSPSNSSEYSITNIANSGGLIRLTYAVNAALATGLIANGQIDINIAGAPNNTDANGYWTATVIDATHIDLAGSTFVNTCAASCGTLRAGTTSAYVDYDGFEIDGTFPGTGTQWFTGFYTVGYNASVTNMKVHDIAYPADSSNGSSGGSAISTDTFFGGSQIDVKNNLVYHCGPQGPAQSLIHCIYANAAGTISNNLIYMTSGCALTRWHDTHNVKWINNTIFNAQDGTCGGSGASYYYPRIRIGTITNGAKTITGLANIDATFVGAQVAVPTQSGTTCVPGATDITFASATGVFVNTVDSSSQVTLTNPGGNNVGTGNCSGASIPVYFGGPDYGAVVSNNLMRDSSPGGMGEGTTNTATGVNTYSFNALYNAGTWVFNGTHINTHTNDSGLTGDPKMVNFQADGSGDYHLTNVSPDVDTGTATNAPGYDFEYTSRPLGAAVDVGAYEFQPSPAASSESWSLISGYSEWFGKKWYAASTDIANAYQTMVMALSGVGELWVKRSIIVGSPTNTIGSAADAEAAAPWGGSKGAGSINAQAVYSNNQQLLPEPAPNFLINPFMQFDQVNEGATYTIGQAGTVVKTLDGWYGKATSAVTGTSTIAKVTTTPPTVAGAYLQYVVGTGNATVNAGDSIVIYQPIVADEITNLGMGTADAKGACLSFYANSSVANAILGGAIQNAAQTRSYPFAFQMSSTVSTWQRYEMPFTGDTAGTWVTTGAAEGMRVMFTLQAGTTAQVASGSPFAVPNSPGVIGNAGSWSTTTAPGKFASGVITQLGKTTGATFRITAVQITPTAACMPIYKRPYGDELSLVQRQYLKTFPQGTAVAQNAGKAGALCNVPSVTTAGSMGVMWTFGNQMLSSPTIVTYNPSAANANWRDIAAAGDKVVSVDPQASKGATGIWIGEQTTALVVGAQTCIHATADSRL